MKIVMKIVMLLAWARDGAHGKVFSQRLSSYKKLRHREAGLEKVRSFICLKIVALFLPCQPQSFEYSFNL
eukprot:8106581-Ditylum_brightwellii.AAC.1